MTKLVAADDQRSGPSRRRPGCPATVLVACAAAGVLNALIFAATLVARSEYAPIEACDQVFVWVGALKITAGSAGTAIAGDIIATALHLPLILGVGLTLNVVNVSVLERCSRLQKGSG